MHPYLPPLFDRADERGPSVLKRLIWIYFWLWILEGPLRKWIFPQFSAPLLVIRDRLVILIYLVAVSRGRAGPMLVWILTGAFGVIMALIAVAAQHSAMLVMLYGLRTNLLHIPLIFVIGEVFNAEDVNKMGKVILWLSIPLVGLAVLQFRAPMDSFLNVGAGASIGGQMEGALGRVRAPSVFSFNGGFVIFLGLALYFSLEELTSGSGRGQSLAWIFLSVVLIGFGISVSRGAIINGALIFVWFLILAVRSRGLSQSVRLAYILPVVILGLSLLPAVRDGVLTFAERWRNATSDEQTTVYEGIVLRTWGTCTGFVDDLDEAPTFGYGLGLGTNVGCYLTTGRVGFLLAENELSGWCLNRDLMSGWPILHLGSGWRCMSGLSHSRLIAVGISSQPCCSGSADRRW